MGNDFSKGVDSAVSIITGIITGDITGGLAGASAPWLAEQIKLHTGHLDKDGKWQTDDIASNLIAHAILGAVVAELQGNSGLAGGAGAVAGEVAADIIRKQLYGKEVKDLTEEEKQTISALSQLAAGLAVAAGGGSVGDAGAAISSSKNAVENNFLSNKYGVEKLDEKGKALYKKLKDAGIGDIDELQAKFEECNGNSDCERDVRNEFREQERKAGEILTQLYQTGQLSREEFEYLNSYYAEAMMYGAGEGQKLHNTGFNLAGDIYDLSGYFWIPIGLISDSYLSAIRYDIMIEDWKAEGLSNEEIQSKLQKLNIIDSGIAPVNVNALLNLYDNGASKDEIMAFAAASVFNKFVGKASNAANKGTKHNIAKADAETQTDVAKYFEQQRQYWSNEPIQFNGNKVYQRNDLFDINFVDSKGRTNLERMKKGLAPIGNDGQPVNLHHMTQKQDGPIAEMSQSFHKGNHRIIHVNDNSIPTGIDRNQFNKWRSQYWKNRANESKK